MSSIKDDRGYNQMWAPSVATEVRTQRRSDAIVAEMRVGTSETVLEIGCGDGTNAFLLASSTGKSVTGVDICQPFIEQATALYRRPNLRYKLLDFKNAGAIGPERFDYIVGNGILHHLYDHLDDSLAQIRNLLTPAGKIIFWEPNLLNPYCFLIFSFSHFRKMACLEPDEMAFSKSFAETKLARAGYRDIRVAYRDFLVPGIPGIFIKPSITLGAVFEKTPGLRILAQSLFITAGK